MQSTSGWEGPGFSGERWPPRSMQRWWSAGGPLLELTSRCVSLPGDGVLGGRRSVWSIQALAGAHEAALQSPTSTRRTWTVAMALLVDGERPTAADIPHVLLCGLLDDGLKHGNISRLALRPTRTARAFADDGELGWTASAQTIAAACVRCPSMILLAWASPYQASRVGLRVSPATPQSARPNREALTLETRVGPKAKAERRDCVVVVLDLLEATPLDHHSPLATATSAIVNTSIIVAATVDT